jgi:ribosome-binding factor A
MTRKGAAGQGSKPSRSQRVAGRFKTELMELVLRGTVRDPALADVYARVYFRLTRPEVGAKDRENALAGLEKASGYLRKELGPRLRLQYMPDLKFFWDDSLDRAARVDAVLAEIRRDEEGGQ